MLHSFELGKRITNTHLLMKLERLTDRELEPLFLVFVTEGIARIRIHRESVAEPEQAERRKPLNGNTGRFFQASIFEAVVERYGRSIPLPLAREIDPAR